MSPGPFSSSGPSSLSIQSSLDAVSNSDPSLSTSDPSQQPVSITTLLPDSNHSVLLEVCQKETNPHLNHPSGPAAAPWICRLATTPQVEFDGCYVLVCCVNSCVFTWDGVSVLDRGHIQVLEATLAFIRRRRSDLGMSTTLLNKSLSFFPLFFLVVCYTHYELCVYMYIQGLRHILSPSRKHKWPIRRRRFSASPSSPRLVLAGSNRTPQHPPTLLMKLTRNKHYMKPCR